MKIKMSYTIGNDTIQFEPESTDVKDQFIELMNIKPRLFCNVCQNDDKKNFRLFVNKTDDGYKYVKIICGSCKAQSTLGTFKDNKGYFWKKFEAYTPKAGVPATKAKTTSSSGINEEDIPF